MDVWSLHRSDGADSLPRVRPCGMRPRFIVRWLTVCVVLGMGWLLTSTARGQEPNWDEPAPPPPPPHVAVPLIPSESPLQEPYFDLDAYMDDGSVLPVGDPSTWTWQLLPDGLIYKSYLAGMKEPRMASMLQTGQDADWYWDAWLGGRVSLIRFGSRDRIWPVGAELQAEAVAMARLDMEEDVNVVATDYRAGFPIVFGWGRHRTKFGYYHISSHLGDEFLLTHPGYPRLNWARDAIVLGHRVFLTPEFNVYGEVGWAFYTDVNEPWEFQFGAEYAPAGPTGLHGAPFFAVNGHLRQENDYGGGLTVQTGWAWRGGDTAHLLRLGFHYYNGMSTQFSFYNQFEQQFGAGLWYDF